MVNDLKLSKFSRIYIILEADQKKQKGKIKSSVKHKTNLTSRWTVKPNHFWSCCFFVPSGKLCLIQEVLSLLFSFFLPFFFLCLFQLNNRLSFPFTLPKGFIYVFGGSEEYQKAHNQKASFSSCILSCRNDDRNAASLTAPLKYFNG